MRATLPVITVSLALIGVVPETAHAQEASGAPFDLDRAYVPFGDHGVVALPGSVRAVGGHVDAVPVRAEDPEVGAEIPDDDFGHFRLRLTPSLTLHGRSWSVFQAYQALVDVDVTAHAFDDSLESPLTWDPVQQERTEMPDPRLMQAYLLAGGSRVAVKAGLMRSGWGPGILANTGEDPEDVGVRQSPFGFARTADRVLRLQLAFFPLDRPTGQGGRTTGGPPLTLALAADAVIDDDTAEWDDGDRAYNFIGAVMGEVGWFHGGLYTVHRNQDHWEGGRTEVTVFDVQAHQDILRGDFSAWVETEIAAMVGTTTYSRSAIREGSFDVGAIGGVGRLGLDWEWLEAVLEVGGASGDDNPFDAKVRSFTFDREYRVGLLMFGEYMRKTSAITALNVSDPSFRMEPSRGFDRTATGGAVQGAMYVNPRLALEPVDGLTFLAGYLNGRATAEFTDAFRTGVNGGVSTGPNGAVTANDLGHEVDLGVEYLWSLEHLNLRSRAEFAWFSPGDAFADEEGEAPGDVTGFWLHMEASW
ncbi:MAG: hypothetical protein ACQEXJ_01670 [Myxococcota bacterium]